MATTQQLIDNRSFLLFLLSPTFLKFLFFPSSHHFFLKNIYLSVWVYMPMCACVCAPVHKHRSQQKIPSSYQFLPFCEWKFHTHLEINYTMDKLGNNKLLLFNEMGLTINHITWTLWFLCVPRNSFVRNTISKIIEMLMIFGGRTFVRYLGLGEVIRVGFPWCNQ